MKVCQDFDRPAHQSFYLVAGRLLFIAGHDSRLAKLIDLLFEGWLLNPVHPSDQRPDVTLTFHCTGMLPAVPGDWEQFEIANGGRCHTDGEDYYLAFRNTLLFVQQADGVRVNLWVKEIPDSPDSELASATSFAVCSGLRRWGLFDIHAGGAVEPLTGDGVLIVGSSGSGKSTLVVQLVKSGWGYLSDDELLLSVTNGKVEARGFRKFFAINETTAAATGINKAQRVENRKICFDPSELFPLRRSERVIPRWLFFSEVSQAENTQLSELTQSEAMMRLIRACPWATYDRAVAAENLNILSLLVRQAKAFELKAGKDLLTSGRAAELLAASMGS